MEIQQKELNEANKKNVDLQSLISEQNSQLNKQIENLQSLLNESESQNKNLQLQHMETISNCNEK